MPRARRLPHIFNAKVIFMRPGQLHRYQFYIFSSNSTINIDDNILGIPMKYAVASINNLPNDRRRARNILVTIDEPAATDNALA